jgi:hypothetical protein
MKSWHYPEPVTTNSFFQNPNAEKKFCNESINGSDGELNTQTDQQRLKSKRFGTEKVRADQALIGRPRVKIYSYPAGIHRPKSEMRQHQ